MPANSSIDLTTLDFDSLKQSFKSYLQSQDIFRDYDFEGSNLNILLELMSVNTFKNAFLINMLMSEAFLDTSQIRASILSHAKELNYLPRSARSAVAKVRVSFTATGESAPYVIPKGKPFTTLVKNHAYTFTTPETIICSSTNNSFTFTTDIYEGVYVQDSYPYTANTENLTFKITNPNIDTRSLEVTVYEDSDDIGEIYQLSTTLLDVSETSKVFFLQTSQDGGYEVLFGDNNIGRKPKDNSIIKLEYRTSSGPAPNGAKRFACDFDPTSASESTSAWTVEVLEVARDGKEEESLESIRYYAPRHFQVQERAITASDFEVSLKTQFPEINAVHAYGGEELIPPQYGRVIVAVDISDVEGLPDSKKTEYYKFLKRRSAFTIEPVFIEPEFSYLSIDARVRYNVNVTPLTADSIEALVSSAIENFKELFLDDFNSILRFSKLASTIDGADTSIVSSITKVLLYKKWNPTLGVKVNGSFNFNTRLRDDVPFKEKSHKAIDTRTMHSSVFVFQGEQCRLEDDGDGKIRVVKIKGDTHEMMAEIGTIDYENGLISIQNLKIDSYYGSSIKIYVDTEDPDIMVSQNTILTIESDETNIEIEEVRV